eukprot:1055431-Prymnesium_polylepis.1
MFGTSLHYGTAVANVEIAQALHLGDSKKAVTAANTSCTASAEIAAVECRSSQRRRVISNVQVVLYQEALYQAYLMDTASTAGLKTAALCAFVAVFDYLKTSTLSSASGSAMSEVAAFATASHTVEDGG